MTLQENIFSENENLRVENESLRAKVRLDTARLELMTQEVSWLNEVVRQFKRDKFGSKSERWTSEEQMVFNEAEVFTEQPKPDEFENEVEVKAHKKARGKRKSLPGNLPREIVEVTLPESECLGEDGKPLKPIGKEISERLYFEPAQLKVIEIHRIRYGADSGDTGVVAPPEPSIIPKSYVTSGLLSHIVMQKYGYGMPLYRQADMFKRMGFEIPRCTQARWIIEASEACRPIWNILEERLLASPYVSCDETWTQVLKEKGRKAESKSWMWVRCTPSDEEKIILFDYDPSRSGEVAQKLFADYQGTLQVDGFSSYNILETQNGIVRIGCNMHGRRKFEFALKIGAKEGQSLAAVAMKFYHDLYEVEKKAREMTWDDRHRLRQELAIPIWANFKKWAEDNQGKVPPKSKLGQAFHYFTNEYVYLTGYLKDGRLEMDNGFAERAITSFAVGRKGWLFSSVVEGAEASALFYSIVVTAKINGNDPQKILKQIFDLVPLAKTLDDYERIADLILTRPI